AGGTTPSVGPSAVVSEVRKDASDDGEALVELAPAEYVGDGMGVVVPGDRRAVSERQIEEVRERVGVEDEGMAAADVESAREAGVAGRIVLHVAVGVEKDLVIVEPSLPERRVLTAL